MKSKLFLLSAMAILCYCASFGQAVNWVNPGQNNINVQPATLGMTNANSVDLQFFTSNAPAMTLMGGNASTLGFVGIGTTAPNIRLDVFDGSTTQLRLSNATTKYANFTVNNTGNLFVDPEGGTMGLTTRNMGLAKQSLWSGAPLAKLEIIDNGGSQPQLRLSYTYNSVFADLQTNSGGDLDISTSSGHVGIGGSSPTSTLHVFGDATINTVAHDDALTKVLVETSGGLIKYRDASTLGGGSISLCGSQATNYVSRFSPNSTTLCNSLIWDDGNYVIIGATSPTYSTKFEVIDNGGNGKIPIFSSTTGTNSSAISSLASGAGSSGLTATASTWGVNAVANGVPYYGGNPIFGVKAEANGAMQTSGINEGVYGFVSTGDINSTNYGVAGSATVAAGGGTVTNYGVYGCATGGDVNWSGYFCHDVQIQGDLWHGASMIFSDQLIKTNVNSIDNADEILSQVQPHSYNYDNDNYGYLHLPSGIQYGVIAEELEPVLPTSVGSTVIPAEYDDMGQETHPALNLKGVNYNSFIALLIKGYQDQQAQIDNLQAQIDGCCGAGLRSSNMNDGNGQSINLVTKDQIQLGNAAPNPNGGITSIPFHLPQSVVKAEMVFTDLLGQEVNRVELGARGFSQINVTTTQLEDGTYNYTLVADGKVIDTKQMVKAH